MFFLPAGGLTSNPLPPAHHHHSSTLVPVGELFPSGPWRAHVWPTPAREKRIFIKIRDQPLSLSNGAFVEGWRAKIWTGGRNPDGWADDPSRERGAFARLHVLMSEKECEKTEQHAKST